MTHLPFLSMLRKLRDYGRRPHKAVSAVAGAAIFLASVALLTPWDSDPYTESFVKPTLTETVVSLTAFTGISVGLAIGITYEELFYRSLAAGLLGLNIVLTVLGVIGAAYPDMTDYYQTGDSVYTWRNLIWAVVFVLSLFGYRYYYKARQRWAAEAEADQTFTVFPDPPGTIGHPSETHPDS